MQEFQIKRNLSQLNNRLEKVRSVYTLRRAWRRCSRRQRFPWRAFQRRPSMQCSTHLRQQDIPFWCWNRKVFLPSLPFSWNLSSCSLSSQRRRLSFSISSSWKIPLSSPSWQPPSCGLPQFSFLTSHPLPSVPCFFPSSFLCKSTYRSPLLLT